MVIKNAIILGRCVVRGELEPDIEATLETLASRADPIADEAFQALLTEGFGKGMQRLEAALSGHPVDDLSDAVRALVHDSEAISANLDHQRVERGALAFVSLGFEPLMTALGLGSLMTTYVSPSFAHQLTRAGNLMRMAPRRLIETGGWLAACLQEGGLKQGAAGYRISVHVRLIHAKMRHALLKGGWDQDHWGAPLSQLDQLQGILVFSFIAMRSLDRAGQRLPEQELDDIYYMWRGIGGLLGVEAVHLVANHQAAASIHDAIETLNGPCASEGAPLAAALLKVFDDRVDQEMQGLQRRIGHDVVRGMAHIYLTPEIASGLGIEKPMFPFWGRILRLKSRSKNEGSLAAAATKSRQDFAAYLDEHFPEKDITQRVLG
jgi:hypothetical protein